MATVSNFLNRLRSSGPGKIAGVRANKSPKAQATLEPASHPIQGLSLVEGPRERRELPEKPLIGIFTPTEPEMHVEVLSAFAKGLERCGQRHFIAPLENGWRDCDVAVTFGVYKLATQRGIRIGEIVQCAIDSNAEHLVLERGFFHRDRYFMAGWNGLNGRADFCNQGVDSDRWNQLGIKTIPWRTHGQHVLVCGQVPWDASVQHVDFQEWCQQTLDQLRQLTDRPIVFRPHPLQPNALNIAQNGVRISSGGCLQDDLQNAWCTVTFNSNSGVEAALGGIPVYVSDLGSMASPISNVMEQGFDQPQMPDRTQWLNRMAYAQWTSEEISSGRVWDHLANTRSPTITTRGTHS